MKYIYLLVIENTLTIEIICNKDTWFMYLSIFN